MYNKYNLKFYHIKYNGNDYYINYYYTKIDNIFITNTYKLVKHPKK